MQRRSVLFSFLGSFVPAGLFASWGARRVMASDSRRCEQSAAIAVLLTPLRRGSSADAQLYVGAPCCLVPGDVVTVWPWKLKTGDVLDAGTEIDLAKVNGHWYLRNAA